MSSLLCDCCFFPKQLNIATQVFLSAPSSQVRDLSFQPSKCVSCLSFAYCIYSLRGSLRPHQVQISSEYQQWLSSLPKSVTHLFFIPPCTVSSPPVSTNSQTAASESSCHLHRRPDRPFVAAAKQRAVIGGVAPQLLPSTLCQCRLDLTIAPNTDGELDLLAICLPTANTSSRNRVRYRKYFNNPPSLQNMGRVLNSFLVVIIFPYVHKIHSVIICVSCEYGQFQRCRCFGSCWGSDDRVAGFYLVLKKLLVILLALTGLSVMTAARPRENGSPWLLFLGTGCAEPSKVGLRCQNCCWYPHYC